VWALVLEMLSNTDHRASLNTQRHLEEKFFHNNERNLYQVQFSSDLKVYITINLKYSLEYGFMYISVI
jgi:hypothetical protein